MSQQYTPSERPPPPPWSPAEERAAQDFVQQIWTNRRKPPPPLSSEERQAAKAVKRQRRKRQGSPSSRVVPDLEAPSPTTGAASSQKDEETLSPDPIPYAERPGCPSSRVVPDPEAAGKGEGDAASSSNGEGSGSSSTDTHRSRENDEGGGSSSSMPSWSCCGEGCKKVLTKQSEFLLCGTDKDDYMDADWCGRYRGLCFDCSKFHQRAKFATAARKAWKQLHGALMTKRDRVRDVKFKGQKALFEIVMPGESKSQIRKATVAFIQALAYAIARDVTKDPALVAFTTKEIDKWMVNVEQQAQTPGWTISTDGRLLDSATIGYMTFITQSTGLCFVCRICGFWGYNHLWYEHLQHAWFKCPDCSKRYYPFASKGGSKTAANMVFFMPEGPQVDSRVVTTLVVWPQTQEHKLWNALIEKHAESIGALAQPQKWLERSMDEMKKYQAKCGQLTCWQQFPWRDNLDFSGYKKPAADGYVGGKIESLERAPVEKDHAVVIALLGNILAGVRSMSKL